MEIVLMQEGHSLWNEMISFAKSCSWKAGPYLAKQMEKNAFQDWERVIAAVEDGGIVGFCTFTEKDELPDEYGYSPFIGFVFVDERYRGRRISETMIQHVLSYAGSAGFRTVYLMSGDLGLYEKYGFVKIGDYQTVWGTVDQLFYIDVQLV